MSFTNPKCSKHFWSHFPFTKNTTYWIRAPTKKPKSWSVFFHPLARLQACSQQYLGQSYPSYHPSFPMALPNHLRVENPTHGSMVCLFFEFFYRACCSVKVRYKGLLKNYKLPLVCDITLHNKTWWRNSLDKNNASEFQNATIKNEYWPFSSFQGWLWDNG